MRYIFLDSNVFFDHWHLNNAEFRLLATFIKNSRSVFLMSEIVCHEVQNLHQREQKKVLSDLKKNYDKAQKFNTEKIEYSLTSLIQPYSFKDLLKEKIEFVEFIPFEEIPHSVVVRRAIEQVLPFRVQEKGYRDTMIWLSLLHFLKLKSADDEVVFISENTRDFYINDEQGFHDDLAKDLRSYGVSCRIAAFISLNAFLTAKVDTNEFEFSNESISDQYMDPIGKRIEEEVARSLDIMQTREFKKLLDASGTFFRYASALLNHGFGIIEGIEDGTVISYKRLTANTLYISYSFNLRRCAIDLTVPTTEYVQRASGIKIFYHEVSVEEDKTHVLYYCRPEFTVSFIYDIEKKEVSGFEILSLQFL
ncbi:MAG TPA: PIN domain-containing protein [Puia sp.]|nr:PIN domain-containing protein [Puia sp.]